MSNAAETPRRQPNILIFMTDQQRAGVVMDGALNRAKTPNLDKMRAESVEFTRLYCPSPHCCPSRTTFFTGHYPSRHGVWNNVNVGNTLSRGPFPGTPFWSQALREAGYALHYDGKWHVSDYDGPSDFGWDEGLVNDAPRNPRRQGQDAHEWALYRPDMQHPDPDNRDPGEITRLGYPRYWHYGTHPNPFGDGSVAESGVAAIKRRAGSDHPWCHYIGPLGPHDPYTPPQEFVDLYNLDDIELPRSFSDAMEDKPALYRRTRRIFDQLSEEEQRDALRHYLAFCSYEDHLFGQALEALEETGQAEDTLVIFMSDHGDYVADHGLWCKGLPCFNGAYHVPCVMRWPAGIEHPGRTVDAMVNLADFAPTFYELTGIENPLPENAPGASLVPFLRNQTPAEWRDAHFTQSNGNEIYGIQRSVMTDKWKFIYNGYDEDELYDLENDPDQIRNIAADPQFAGVIRDLSKRLWQFAYEQEDNCVNPYIMVGLAPHGPGVIYEG